MTWWWFLDNVAPWLPLVVVVAWLVWEPEER